MELIKTTEILTLITKSIARNNGLKYWVSRKRWDRHKDA